MTKAQTKRGGWRGFTLLELGIVIGVSAILAAAIIPDLVETMRNRFAEKAAKDVTLIQDAARLYYVQDTANNLVHRWPGEQSNGQCNTGGSYSEALGETALLGGNYLTAQNGFLKNPWGRAYDITVYQQAASLDPTPSCLFGVVTDVPTSISQAFISFLPMAACGANCPPSAAPVPAGYTHCCSFVPKPGAQLQSACASVGATYTIMDCSGVMKCCNGTCASCN